MFGSLSDMKNNTFLHNLIFGDMDESTISENIFLYKYSVNDKYREIVDNMLLKLIDRIKTYKYDAAISYLYGEILNMKYVEIMSSEYRNGFIFSGDILNKRPTKHIAILYKTALACICAKKLADLCEGGTAESSIDTKLNLLTLISYDYAVMQEFITNDILDTLGLTASDVREHIFTSINPYKTILGAVLYSAMYNVFKENNIDTDDIYLLLRLNSNDVSLWTYTYRSKYYTNDIL